MTTEARFGKTEVKNFGPRCPLGWRRESDKLCQKPRVRSPRRRTARPEVNDPDLGGFQMRFRQQTNQIIKATLPAEVLTETSEV